LTTRQLTEHFFRHEYGRLVAMLSRRVGMRHLEAVEDAVQSTLLTALKSWTTDGTPENPSAWLFRVAHNHAVEELRRRARHDHLLQRRDREEAQRTEDIATELFTGELQDDLLRMLFLCCDSSIPIESQLAIALKVLCGFDVSEIAERLFTTEANVYKRLGRARNRLRELPFEPDQLTAEQLALRLPAVQSVLYLIFNEGYLSHAEPVIRRELCDEAKRLTLLLAEHPAGRTPETFALLALMHLHAARLSARQDGSGGLLLLEEQDRAHWDQRQVHSGLAWLAGSAQGDVFSRYHAEAGIAAEHCLAPTFEETRWDRIVECYELLERLAPSALHRLNRAVAVAQWRGPTEGLAILEGFEPPTWLAGSYMWAAVLADLYRRSGRAELAQRYRDTAIGSAPSPAVRDVLKRRLLTRGAGDLRF
jgi:RNA polymerase sigma factor (sigma-70 family)